MYFQLDITQHDHVKLIETFYSYIQQVSSLLSIFSIKYWKWTGAAACGKKLPANSIFNAIGCPTFAVALEQGYQKYKK